MSAKIVIDNGLLVDSSTNPPTAIGYIFNFAGHGAFAPNGKVGEFSEADIARHNSLLAEMELEALKKQGRGVLYLTERGVTQWAGGFCVPVTYRKKSFHNFAGRDGRTDVWFNLDGSQWHGVNIGDSQILRVKRLKG